MKLAIVGATGMVGSAILKVLDEYKINLENLILVASESSAGKEINFRNKKYSVITLEKALSEDIDIAIFSAGKTISLEWAPKFAEKGIFVVDNSSAWRMHEDKKLIVPEVNIALLNPEDKIIANPNCSTIQLMVVLWPLHKKFGLERVIVSTYQSVTGSGYKGMNQLETEEREQKSENPAYPHQIHHNCIPHGGAFLENLYTEEEEKLIKESQKILGLPDLKITSTVVRVPVLGGHSESVNIEFKNKPELQNIIDVLRNAPGVIIEDNPIENIYPMPINSHNKNETYVGRIRLDNSNVNAINLWIVADNLRKGAATNAVQIAEYIEDNFLSS